MTDSFYLFHSTLELGITRLNRTQAFPEKPENTNL